MPFSAIKITYSRCFADVAARYRLAVHPHLANARTHAAELDILLEKDARAGQVGLEAPLVAAVHVLLSKQQLNKFQRHFLKN